MLESIFSVQNTVNTLTATHISSIQQPSLSLCNISMERKLHQHKIGTQGLIQSLTSSKLTITRSMSCSHICPVATFRLFFFKPEMTAVLEDESTLVSVNSATIFTLFLEQKSFPRLPFFFLVQPLKLFTFIPRRYDTTKCRARFSSWDCDICLGHFDRFKIKNIFSHVISLLGTFYVMQGLDNVIWSW